MFRSGCCGNWEAGVVQYVGWLWALWYQKDDPNLEAGDRNQYGVSWCEDFEGAFAEYDQYEAAGEYDDFVAEFVSCRSELSDAGKLLSTAEDVN